VATSIAAFIGRTSKGPVNEAVRLLSYQEFERVFGPPHPKNEMGIQVHLFFQNGGSRCSVIRVTDARRPTLTDYLGHKSKSNGLYALDKIDLFNLMIIPKDNDLNDPDVYLPLLETASTYCRTRRAFLLIDPPGSWKSVNDVLNPSAGIERLRDRVVKDHCALFFPNLVISEKGKKKDVGPVGAVAGLMARTDRYRGVWKAPAGTDASILGIEDLTVTVTDNENDVLNKKGINCLRSFRQGFVNWGTRTLSGTDTISSEWKYIPVKRLAMFLEGSIFRGTMWAASSPNEEPLWAQIRLNVGTFMQSLFRQGAFSGQTPEEAYFVKCDKETTTQADINEGIVNIIVGFAPLKPAEFVVMTIQQTAGKI
jgi:phage tail sheath protein FI